MWLVSVEMVIIYFWILSAHNLTKECFSIDSKTLYFFRIWKELIYNGIVSAANSSSSLIRAVYCLYNAAVFMSSNSSVKLIANYAHFSLHSVLNAKILLFWMGRIAFATLRKAKASTIMEKNVSNAQCRIAMLVLMITDVRFVWMDLLCTIAPVIVWDRLTFSTNLACHVFFLIVPFARRSLYVINAKRDSEIKTGHANVMEKG